MKKRLTKAEKRARREKWLASPAGQRAAKAAFDKRMAGYKARAERMNQIPDAELFSK